MCYAMVYVAELSLRRVLKSLLEQLVPKDSSTRTIFTRRPVGREVRGVRTHPPPPPRSRAKKVHLMGS